MRKWPTILAAGALLVALGAWAAQSTQSQRLGTLFLDGSTSGSAKLQAQATAGTPALVMPTGSGTLASSATSPIVLNATTGVVSCPTCGTGSGTVTSIATTAPLAGGTITTTGTLSITGAAGQVLAGSGPAFTRTPTLGVAGASTGTLALAGATSGTATITPQATAGTPTITLPNASGTVAVSGTSPIVVDATTGAVSCPTCNTGTASVGAVVAIAAAQNVANNGGNLTWDSTPIKDDGGFFSAGSPTLLTVPSTGWYNVCGNVGWDTNTTGIRVINILVNGTTFIFGNFAVGNAGVPRTSVCGNWYASAGTTFIINVFQNSGGVRTVCNNPVGTSCYFSIVRFP